MQDTGCKNLRVFARLLLVRRALYKPGGLILLIAGSWLLVTNSQIRSNNEITAPCNGDWLVVLIIMVGNNQLAATINDNAINSPGQFKYVM